MGKTYAEYPLDLSELHTAWFAKRPIQAVDNPNQAGEGILPEEYDDPQVGEQLYLNSGLQYMVAALFASGSGPVAESKAPYHGKEATPEPWVVTHDPDAWIQNYLRFNAEKLKTAENLENLPEALRPAPAMTKEQLLAEAEQELKKKQDEIATGYYLLWYQETTGGFPQQTKTAAPSGCSGNPGC